jgi:serine/threonine protein kinase
MPRLEPGVVLADTYKILRLLGEGGMAEVYEAAHTRFSAHFAVKVLLDEVTPPNYGAPCQYECGPSGSCSSYMGSCQEGSTIGCSGQCLVPTDGCAYCHDMCCGYACGPT